MANEPVFKTSRIRHKTTFVFLFFSNDTELQKSASEGCYLDIQLFKTKLTTFKTKLPHTNTVNDLPQSYNSLTLP